MSLSCILLCVVCMQTIKPSTKMKLEQVFLVLYISVIPKLIDVPIIV